MLLCSLRANLSTLQRNIIFLKLYKWTSSDPHTVVSYATPQVWWQYFLRLKCIKVWDWDLMTSLCNFASSFWLIQQKKLAFFFYNKQVSLVASCLATTYHRKEENLKARKKNVWGKLHGQNCWDHRKIVEKSR